MNLSIYWSLSTISDHSSGNAGRYLGPQLSHTALTTTARSAALVPTTAVIWFSYSEIAVHADGHPVGEHLLHHGFCSPQHQLGVFGS